MPLSHERITLPCGKPAFRLNVTGKVTGEDGKALRKLTNEGGPYCGLPEVAVLDATTEMSPEFREAVVKRDAKAQTIPLAVVLLGANAVLRTTTKFVVKAEGTASNKFFETVEEGIRWLDEVVRAG